MSRRHKCAVTADRIDGHLHDARITELLSESEFIILATAKALLVELAETRVR